MSFIVFFFFKFCSAFLYRIFDRPAQNGRMSRAGRVPFVEHRRFPRQTTHGISVDSTQVKLYRSGLRARAGN